MNLRERLTERINKNDIREIISCVSANESEIEKLYQLIFDEDKTVSYQALWICTHFNQEENKWLESKQQEIIEETLQCTHPGKRRLLLSLLHKQSFPDPPRVDFLDFCLEHMMSKDELPAAKSLCMKLAYELCKTIPELMSEYRNMLELMEPSLLASAVRAVRRNTLKSINAFSKNRGRTAARR